MLQFITHQTPRFGIIEGAVAALNGGCKWIQLRMKGAPIEAVRQSAQQLIPLCKEHEAILVLDDYAQLAADLDIDGVHLGKLDMPVSEARLLIGEKYIIGGTANTFEDIQGLGNDSDPDSCRADRGRCLAAECFRVLADPDDGLVAAAAKSEV